MKKLITMIAAAAMSFGLFADGEAAWNSVKYDEALQDRAEGDTTIVGFDDAGTTTGPIHWWINGFEPETINQPAAVSNDTAVGNYLKVETEKGKPMLRTFDDVTVGDESASYDPVGITQHGLFVDTKVRMTGTDVEPTIPDGNTNKLIVWLKAVEADADTEGSTNLMVTCGYVDEFYNITPTNYVLDADVKPGEWVRLTVRADKGEKNVPAFKIYVEGEQVKSVDGPEVFPSLVGGKAADVALNATGFDGTGDINYVNLLSENDAPAFAADETTVAITWGDHVASVKIDEKDVNPAVPYVVTAFGEDITATITYEEGYRRASVTPTGFADGCFTEDIANNQFTFSVARYANASVEIAAELDRNEAGLVIDDTPIGTFSSLAAAFAKIKELYPTVAPQNPPKAVITMNEDASADDFGFNMDDVQTDVTIDLNGHTIECTNENVGFYAFEAAGVLEICDSSALGGGKIIGNIYADYELDVRQAAQDIVIDGAIDYAVTAVKGYDTYITIERAKVNDPMEAVEGIITLGLPGEDMEWAGPDEDGFYTLVEAADYVAQIGADKYKTLAEAVAAVGENETIELLKNCASVGISVPSGKAFTIDFAGKKVTFNKPGAGSPNTKTQAFQLLQGSTIVFKNGTICCSAENKDMTWVKDDAEKGIAMIIQNYANLTLEGMTIDGANIAKNGSTAARYLISNNSGDVVFEDTIITANEGDIAFDTCKYKTYTLPTVEVKGTSAITGDVELSGGNLTLTAGELNGELIDAGIGDGVITKADGFEAGAPAGYKWDEQTGILIPCDYVAQIGDNKYETLAAAVAAAKTGDTITLLKSCSGAGIFLAANAGKTITLDLGGFTYTCVGPAVGSNGTASQAFHLEKGNTVTIKDGTVTSTENSGVTMLVQNYCDLTVTGVTLDGSNLPQALYWADSTHTSTVEGPTYTMSNNSGTIALGEGTVIKVSTKTASGVAFDTCKYATYDVPSITVDGATINGDVELSGGNLTLTAGTLTGALVDAGIGDGVITKAAGFTAAAPAGYKWDEDGKLVKDEGKEIKPGEIATDIEAKDAEEALSKVTIKPINDEAAAAGQAAVITGKATQDGETGKWTVEPVINEKAPEFKEPDLVVETTLEQMVAGTDGAEVTVALPAEKVTPGLYYSVDVSTELGEKADFVEGERVLATGTGVSLKVTKPTGGKAFFKVSEHMAPTPANVATQD